MMQSSQGNSRETMQVNSIVQMVVKIQPMQSRIAQSNPSLSFLSKTRKSISRIAYLIPLYCFVLGMGLVGCSNSGSLGIGGLNLGNIGVNSQKIGDLLNNPSADTSVSLQGQVTNRAPLLDINAYKLKDSTGTIWVFTPQTETLPNVGDEVLIKGKLQFQSIPIGGYELGEVYVQQEQLIHRKAGQLGKPVLPEGTP